MKLFACGLLLLGSPLVAPSAAVAQTLPPITGGPTLVFIADGAADSTSVHDNLRELRRGRWLNFRPQPVPWCRHGSVLLDYQDEEAQLTAAAHLARISLELKQASPGCRIVFVGHSAGTRVVLAAAEMLPAASVERIVLLSSSVSYCYDLSGALRASRQGIDNFYSPYDALLAQTTDAGTSDGVLAVAAGQAGFRCPPGAGAPHLYRNLRQYRWQDTMPGQGGHFVWTLSANLGAYVLPLILNDPAPPVFGPARASVAK